MNMNKLQRRNQRVVAETLGKSLLITSIDVSTDRFIDVQTTTWEKYWCRCDCAAEEIERLHGAWNILIASGYSAKQLKPFVQAYFALLHTCLNGYLCGQIDLSVLRKVVGFETFSISCKQGELAAGIFNVRNPAYLLSRVALPKAPEDPKFLPLICPHDSATNSSQLFCHYRRIGISKGCRAQLFVYPPVDARYRSSSYWLISELFASLTQKNDPWVEERTRLLFDSAFADLVASTGKNRLRLLDIACGSARMTMGLSRKAFVKYGISFDLTLVDVVLGAASIARTFYRNPRVYGNIVFRHENLFNWIDKINSNSTCRFDLILMLRICDMFRQFQIEEVSYREARALIRRERGEFYADMDMTRPARLIEENRLDRLHHRLWRSPFKNGMIFHQFSLSDYFSAIKIVIDDEVSGIESMIHAPIRRFDETALALPSGRSLIVELMKMTDKILIEDCDLTPSHLRRHLKLFGLKDLSVMDLTERQGGRGASVTVIGKHQSLNRFISTVSAVTSGIVAEQRI
jgi:hypothetical protein